MRIGRLSAVALTAIGLTFTLSATPAHAACSTLESGGVKVKACAKPSWAKAKRATIKVRVNGKKKATYSAGKPRTFKFTVDFKGFGLKGTCRMRLVEVVTSPQLADPMTYKSAWEKVPCAGLAMQMTTAKQRYSTEAVPQDAVPVKDVGHFEVKTPKGKVVKSNPYILTVKSAYTPPGG